RRRRSLGRAARANLDLVARLDRLAIGGAQRPSCGAAQGQSATHDTGHSRAAWRGAVHAEGVQDAGEDEGDACRPQYPSVAASQLEQAEQDQDDRHVLVIIAVPPMPPEQRFVAAVTDADLELSPRPAHPSGEPDVKN